MTLERAGDASMRALLDHMFDEVNVIEHTLFLFWVFFALCALKFELMELVTQVSMQLHSFIDSFASRAFGVVGKPRTDAFEILRVFSSDPMPDALLTEGILALGTLFRVNNHALAHLAHEVVVERLRGRADVGFGVN